MLFEYTIRLLFWSELNRSACRKSERTICNKKTRNNRNEISCVARGKSVIKRELCKAKREREIERGKQKGNDAESGIKDIDFETYTKRWKKLSDEWNCAVESDQLRKI